MTTVTFHLKQTVLFAFNDESSIRGNKETEHEEQEVESKDETSVVGGNAEKTTSWAW